MSLTTDYEKLSKELSEEETKLHLLKKKIEGTKADKEALIASATKIGALKEQLKTAT